MTVTQTIGYSGSVRQVVVPAQCTKVTITAKGAGGDAAAGGAGGLAAGTYTVAPGDILYVRVGGAGGSTTPPRTAGGVGGYNGGGTGGSSTGSGGQASPGGGGATDVRRNADTLAARIIVAGGGGATSAGNLHGGGAGGASTGEAGGAGTGTGSAGGGGSQTAGGAGGAGLINAGSGADGSLGQGGRGSNHSADNYYAGGGGGGGYYGGGGGGGARTDQGNPAGGGGGSNYVGNGTSTTSTRAAGSSKGNNGSAVLVMNYPPNPPTLLAPAPVSGDDVDATQSVTLSWQFSDPGVDSQSAFQFRYRVGTGAWTTSSKTTSTNQFVALTSNTLGLYVNQKIEWQVRTYDQSDAVSDWSASGYFTPRPHPNAPTFDPTPTAISSTAPTLNIVSDVLAHYWQVRTLSADGSSVLATGSVVTSSAGSMQRSMQMPAPSGGFVNFTSYRASIRYAVYDGVWSDWTTSDALPTNINAPRPPTLVLSPIPEEGSIRVDITNPTPDSYPPLYNLIYRDDQDDALAEEQLIGRADVNGNFTDLTPASRRLYRYRVEAYNATTFTSSD